MSETADKIRTFIVSEILLDDDSKQLTEDTPLLDGGLIDSLALMQLTGYIEEEFAIQIPDSDFTSENFGTIRTIVALIDAQQGQSKAQP